MGLCKCPKRKVTNQFCFEHRVNVCEHCMVSNHPKCVVQSYCQWLKDSDYSALCALCQLDLSQDDCIRLICYHIFHLKCLDDHCKQYPSNTVRPDTRVLHVAVLFSLRQTWSHLSLTSYEQCWWTDHGPGKDLVYLSYPLTPLIIKAVKERRSPPHWRKPQSIIVWSTWRPIPPIHSTVTNQFCTWKKRLPCWQIQRLIVTKTNIRDVLRWHHWNGLWVLYWMQTHDIAAEGKWWDVMCASLFSLYWGYYFSSASGLGY